MSTLGIDHVGLTVADRKSLDALFEKSRDWPGVVAEFALEFSGIGPKVHCMLREPGGTRLELSYDPR